MAEREIPAHVLALAARQFRTKGYAGTTTRELASLLGVQNASVYHYFEKKEDLLYIVASEAIRNLTETVSQALSECPRTEERLRRLVHAHMGVILGDPDSHTVMLIELRSLSPRRRSQVIARRNEYENIAKAEIGAIQDAGGIRTDIDASVLTLLLFNLMNWSVFWYNLAGPLSPDELSDLVLEVFLSGCGQSGEARVAG